MKTRQEIINKKSELLSQLDGKGDEHDNSLLKAAQILEWVLGKPEFERVNNGYPHIWITDFDLTLALDGHYPDIGRSNNELIEFLINERKDGNEVILNTMREGKELDEAVAWCKQQGLEFDAVNENLPRLRDLYKNNPRKLFGNSIFDDMQMIQVHEDGSW